MKINELIIQCQQGNRQAEKDLFFRFAGKVLTICRRYTKSDADAKDYMQECFINVFENIRKYDADKGVFGGWLYQVCTNRILELIRKNKKQIKVVYVDILPTEADEITDNFDSLISAEELLNAIQELPKGYREILNLYAFEGLRHQEIAQHLNISVSTSRSQYTRAKLLLKSKIQKKTGIKYGRC